MESGNKRIGKHYRKQRITGIYNKEMMKNRLITLGNAFYHLNDLKNVQNEKKRDESAYIMSDKIVEQSQQEINKNEDDKQ
jgi:hypothetical protein